MACQCSKGDTTRGLNGVRNRYAVAAATFALFDRIQRHDIDRKLAGPGVTSSVEFGRSVVMILDPCVVAGLATQNLSIRPTKNAARTGLLAAFEVESRLIGSVARFEIATVTDSNRGGCSRGSQHAFAGILLLA